jgi:hypothetical protein
VEHFVNVRFERKGLWLAVAAALLLGGVLLIVLPFALRARSADASGSGRRPLDVTGVNAAAPPADATVATATVVRAPATWPTVDTPPVQADPVESTAVPVPAAAIAKGSSKAPSLDAYRGLGMWVDLYDDPAWRDPSAAVADMAKHSVRTLYLETSNSRSKSAIKDPAATAEFIRASHAHGMKIVAWYLPDTKKPATDYSRIAQAIAFKTADGQKFDSFALDIESSAIKSETARNRALNALSARIRRLVGPTYPLGAIIPSPVGLAKKMGYWDDFPYEAVAKKYDVFVPMSYYTYHGKTAKAAYADTRANVRILRAQKGCAKIPIHLIGGIAEKSSAAELREFVRAARETDCFGASFYSWPGTTASHWRELKAIKL